MASTSDFSGVDNVEEMTVNGTLQNIDEQRPMSSLGSHATGNETLRDHNNMATVMLNMQEQMKQNNTVMESLIKIVNTMQNNSTPAVIASTEPQPGPSNSQPNNKGEKRKIYSDISDSESEDGFSELVRETDEPSDIEEADDDEDGEQETEKILAELAECFGTEEKCGPDILEKLAKVANDGLRTKLQADKIKETSDQYIRPKNVQHLITPKVNTEVWTHLHRDKKNQDLRMQKTQTLVCKAIIPQLRMLNVVLQAQSKKGERIKPKDVCRLAMDSLKLMTFVYCDLSYRRREGIVEPWKNEECRAFCSTDQAITDNLFGDDIVKSMEGFLKGNKVGSKLAGTKGKFGKQPFKKKRYNQHKNFGSSTPYNTNNKSHFLGQNHHNNNNFKKGPPKGKGRYQ